MSFKRESIPIEGPRYDLTSERTLLVFDRQELMRPFGNLQTPLVKGHCMTFSKFHATILHHKATIDLNGRRKKSFKIIHMIRNS